MSLHNKAAIRKEIALAYCAALAVTFVGAFLLPTFSFAGLGAGLIAAGYVIIAIRFAERASTLKEFGIALGGLWERRSVEWLAFFREIAIGTAISLVIFIPYVFGYVQYLGLNFADYHFALPPRFWTTFANNIVVVAIPEEMLFRGYFQTRLKSLFGNKGSSLAITLLLQALLFSLVHLFATESFMNPLRLFVFFPALLFGLLREWRDGVGAAIVVHVLSNMLSLLMVAGWS